MLYSLLALRNLPAGLVLVIVWKTLNYKYVRFVDFGVLAGFSSKLLSTWSGNTVLDCIATTIDIARLGLLQRRTRSKEIDKAFSVVFSLSKTQHSKLSTMLALVEDVGDNIRHVSYGTCFQDNAHMQACRQYILEPGTGSDTLEVLRNFMRQPPVTLNFQQQIQLFNCLPALNVSFTVTPCQRLSVAQGRFLTACKNLFIRGEVSNIDAIHAAALSSQPFRRRGTCRKGALTSPFTDNDEDVDVDGDPECNGAMSNDPVGERTSFVVPVVEKFKSLLQRQGILRVLKQSESCVDVIWNKFDAVKGNIFISSHRYSFE